MLRVMLPFITTANIGAVTAADVGVADKVVVVVDVDVVVAPAAAPAPAASAPRSSHRPANSERDRACSNDCTCRIRRIVNRRIRIDWRAIDNRGRIRRHIDDIWISLLDDDHRLFLNDLCLYSLLRVGLQGSCALRFLAHSLNGVHNVALLREKSIAKFCRPLNVIGQPLHQVWESRHSLNARVPRLFRDSIGKRLALQVFISLKPLLKLYDFERVGRSHKRLAEQRVRIKRDGRNK